jgi:hypothetical protein
MAMKILGQATRPVGASSNRNPVAIALPAQPL